MAIDPDKEHESLFCPATLRLGYIHWYVMRASTLMEAKTTVRTKGPIGVTSVQPAKTDFAKNVGWDEINWWVCRRENNLEELRRQTEGAREAAQSLMRAADNLRRNRFDSYPDLLKSLKQFAEQHSQEIDVIHEYVRWLAERDILAPVILFTYRVWGSTRRSDRWIDVAEIKPEEEGPPQFRRLAEVVLGLCARGLYAVDKAEYDIGADMADGMDGEDVAIRIPVTSIVRRASDIIFDESAVYFRELRDSLSNILLDINKYIDDQELIRSDGFWRDFVSKAIRTKKAEPQLWDFKETLTMWVAQREARDNGKIAFAEDVASFANAEGGVLVIGVNDRREIVGIGDDIHENESRLKFASDVLAKHLEYDREVATLHQVEVEDKVGNRKLCLIVIVARTCSPVGVKLADGRYSYPVRHETGITRESRSDIATRKTHFKSDSYEFFDALKQFVRDAE